MKTYLRWILAVLAVAGAFVLNNCKQEESQPTVEQIQNENPGLILNCNPDTDEIEVVESTPETQEAAEEYAGDYCDPSEEEGNTNTTKTSSNSSARHHRLARHRLARLRAHPDGSASYVTDDPQPNIFSEALEPANAAGTAFQIQDEFLNLLPLPLGPYFTAAGLANYQPACSPNTFVFMANYSNSTVSRLALCPLAIQKVIPVSPSPIQVRITPDGSTAVVTVSGNQVLLINTVTNAVTTIPTPLYSPYGVAITPDGTKAYVTSFSTTQPVIFQINLTTGQLLPQSLQVNSLPKSIFLTPDGAMAWVNFGQSSTIYVIDLLSMTVVSTLNAGGTADTGMAFSPDGTRAYVSVFGGSVTVFNTATLAKVASIQVGDQPTDIAVSKNGTRAYVTSFATNGVTSVIDTQSNTVIGTLPQKGPAMGLIIFH
jgi:YVTN family beta-propeller protein